MSSSEPSAVRRFRWSDYVPGSTLARVFAADRPLGLAFLLLAALTIAPVFFVPTLPFPDLSANVGSAGLIVPILLGWKVASHHFHLLLEPIPYWTAYLVMGAVSPLFGAFASAKAIVLLDLLLLPLAVTRLLVAFGRNPRLGLWAFLMSWEHNLHCGWVQHSLGMSLVFIVLAKVVEADSVPRALRVIPWTALIAVTHILAVGYLLLTAGLIALNPRGFLERLKLSSIALSGALCAFLPFVFKILGPRTGTPSPPFDFQYPPIQEKLGKLFTYTLDNLPGQWSEAANGFAFCLLIVGPLALTLLPRNDTATEDRWAPFTPVLAAVLLYFAAPFAVNGPISHWYTYPRFASLILVGLLFVPRPRLDGRRAWALFPGVVALAATMAITIKQLREFGEHARPFVAIEALVKRDTRVLPLVFEYNDAATRQSPYNTFHAYFAPKGVYDPGLFDNPSIPVLYRHENVLPNVYWAAPEQFTMQDHGKYYDYIFVQGLARDPVPAHMKGGGHHAVLLKEAGMWRLYGVVKD